MSHKNSNNKSKKLSLLSKILISVFSIALVLIIIGISVFYFSLNKLNNVNLEKENLGVVQKEELQQYDNYKKIKNIALFGIDSTNGVGRSDSIMVATIDPAHNKLKITSIMRDSYVNINGYGYDKINHAYAYGGPELSIKTINETFGLNIEDFVAVDFASLPFIIDTLGGVELNITEEELSLVNQYINDINFKDGTSSPLISYSGSQLVDGVQALAYSRIRYTSGGDYERTQRQRTVLSKLFEKALTISPTQYITVINKVLPLVKTSLSSNDILSLATKVVTIGGGSLEQDRFPRDGYSSGEMINGVYYLVFDEATTKAQMMDYIFDDK